MFEIVVRYKHGSISASFEWCPPSHVDDFI